MSVNSDNQNLQVCPICYNEFCKERPKKVFSCCHSLCEVCIKQMYCNELYRCPECRKEFRDEMDSYCLPFELDPYKKRNLDNQEIELNDREAGLKEQILNLDERDKSLIHDEKVLKERRERNEEYTNKLLRREFLLLENEEKLRKEIMNTPTEQLKELDEREKKLKLWDRSLYVKSKCLDEEAEYVRLEMKSLDDRENNFELKYNQGMEKLDRDLFIDKLRELVINMNPKVFNKKKYNKEPRLSHKPISKLSGSANYFRRQSDTWG